MADFPHINPSVHGHKYNHCTFSNYCNHILCQTHCSNCSKSKLIATRSICKPVHIVSCDHPVIFSPVYKFFNASNVNISKTVCCSVSCKSVSNLIISEPVYTFFVMCKPVCFSNASKTKNSIYYCSVTCIELPENAISSAVTRSAVSCRIACPVDFSIAVQNVNATLLCTHRCLFKITWPHYSHSRFHFETPIAFRKLICLKKSCFMVILLSYRFSWGRSPPFSRRGTNHLL